MINKENFDWGCCVPSFIEFNEYEIFDTKIYEKFFEVEKNDIVVDIGASVGPFTYSILNKNPKHCYVVEPMDEQFIFLKKNLEGSPVSFSKLAITDKDSLTISWGGNTCIPRTLKFNEYIKENNLNKIDFLKIDCEGGEYNIFAEPNIDFLLSIPKIVCEFHLDYGENNTNFKNFIENILINFKNYEVYSIDGCSIKWDLYNEHFINYYQQVLFYFNNKENGK